jgi:hypothetical protein
MNLAPLSSLPAVLADIIVPPPPPPGGVMPRHLMGSGMASLGFWIMAAVAIAFLWWLRKRRVAGIAAEKK